MFDLRDNRHKRRKTIMGYAQIDARHGVILSAMDFEWTCRRATLALSKTATVVLYEKFIKEYSAFGGLEKAWREEVLPFTKDAIALHDLVSKKVQWKFVHDAMQCRNAIVHGTESRVNDDECRWSVCVLEDACDAVEEYVRAQKKDIFKKIGRRRSSQAIAEGLRSDSDLKKWHDRVGKEIAKYGGDHWIRTGKIC